MRSEASGLVQGTLHILIPGEWRMTKNNRPAKYYLTPHGRARLTRPTRQWEVQMAPVARILAATTEAL